VRSTEKQAASWDDLPADIKSTYDKLGIPEAEKQRLIAGVAAQYESESSTTRSARTWRRRVSSSWTLTPRSRSTRTFSGSTSPRSSRWASPGSARSAVHRRRIREGGQNRSISAAVRGGGKPRSASTDSAIRAKARAGAETFGNQRPVGVRACVTALLRSSRP